MFKNLEKIFKSIKGNVLTIGIDDMLLESFKNNNNVNIYTINPQKSSLKGFKKHIKRSTNKGKNINIKKLRKYINKNSANYIICNMNEVIDYYKYIIKDTIFISNNIIYIYFDNNIDVDFIISKYKRYNVTIRQFKYKNGYLLEIDNRNGKTNFFKDRINLIKDTFYNISEMIGNILVN